MNKLLTLISGCFVLLFVSMEGKTQQHELTLNGVLAATLENQLNNDSAVLNDNEQSDSSFLWLDGVPTVSMLYLNNQTTNGTKELELSVSLPIKSSIKKAAEGNLTSNSAAIKQSAKLQLSLYYSGLIRTLVWDIHTQQALLDTAIRKHAVLSDLLEQYTDMAELNAMPQYAVYLLQKELSDSQILQLGHQRSIIKLQEQYTTITGLKLFPNNFNEALPNSEPSFVNQHPDIVALDAAWEAYALTLSNQGKSAEPWTIQLTARRIETFDFSENQLGLGVDLPIAIGDNLSASQRNEFLQAKLQYEVQRNKLMTDVLTSSKSSTAEYHFLTSKQEMLNQSAKTLDALETSIHQLLQSNTQNQALHLRNLIDLIDAKNDIALNKIAIHRQIALMRQAAGLPL